MALQNLRTDFDLRNVIAHTEATAMPPFDAKSIGKHPFYVEQHHRRLSAELVTSFRRSTTSPKGTKAKVLKFRRFDTVARSFMLNGAYKERARFARCMPIAVIGGISKAEFAKLGGELYGVVSHNSDISRSRMVTDQESIPGCGERAHIVMSWLYQMLYERIREGGLAVPPPVLSRVFAVLSDGVLGYEQCRKITDTPFPFPWAQLVIGLVVGFAIFCPILINDFVTNIYYAVVLDFFSVLVYWSLAEVARDLEDPFVYDPNDLPLARYQFAFNERIIAVTHSMRPPSSLEESKAHAVSLPDDAYGQLHD